MKVTTKATEVQCERKPRCGARAFSVHFWQETPRKMGVCKKKDNRNFERRELW